jgi:hypothetical protein
MKLNSYLYFDILHESHKTDQHLRTVQCIFLSPVYTKNLLSDILRRILQATRRVRQESPSELNTFSGIIVSYRSHVRNLVMDIPTHKVVLLWEREIRG